MIKVSRALPNKLTHRNDLLIFVSLVILLLAVRGIYGLTMLSHLGTEDAYGYLLYAETIKQEGHVDNSLVRIEPRTANLPPNLPLLSAILMIFTQMEGEPLFIYVSFLLQILSIILIYKILMSTVIEFRDKRVLLVFGTFIFASNWRYILVSSLTLVDTLVLFLSTLTTYCYLEFWRGKKKTFLYMSFVFVGSLGFSHNYGNFLFGILFLSYLLGLFLFERKEISLLSKTQLLLVGFLISFVYSYQSLIKAIKIYAPGVEFALKETPTYMGLSFLNILPEFYSELILYLLLPLGILFLLYRPKANKFIFVLWLISNLVMLMIIPESYSHKSRYPLQILVPLTISSTVGISMVLMSIKASYKSLVSALLIIILLLPITTYVNEIKLWQKYIANSYGIRKKMGTFMRENHSSDRFFHVYWPSFLYGFNKAPSDRMVSYDLVIQNSENPAFVAINENIDYFIYDKLSGHYYPFPDKTKDLLSSGPIKLKEVKLFAHNAVIYKIRASNQIRYKKFGVNDKSLDFIAFSDTKYQRIFEDAYSVIRPQQIPYRVLENTEGEIKISIYEKVADPVIYIALMIRPNTRIRILVKDTNGSERGKLTLSGEYLKGWEWWFEFYKIDIRGPELSDKIVIYLSKNKEGYLAVYRADVMYKADYQ